MNIYWYWEWGRTTMVCSCALSGLSRLSKAQGGHWKDPPRVVISRKAWATKGLEWTQSGQNESFWSSAMPIGKEQCPTAGWGKVDDRWTIWYAKCGCRAEIGARLGSSRNVWLPVKTGTLDLKAVHQKSHCFCLSQYQDKVQILMLGVVVFFSWRIGPLSDPYVLGAVWSHIYLPPWRQINNAETYLGCVLEGYCMLKDFELES